MKTGNDVRVYSHRARELPLAITLGKEYIDFNGIIHTKREWELCR